MIISTMATLQSKQPHQHKHTETDMTESSTKPKKPMSNNTENKEEASEESLEQKQMKQMILRVNEMVEQCHKDDMPISLMPMVVYYTAQCLADAIQVPAEHILGAVFELLEEDIANHAKQDKAIEEALEKARNIIKTEFGASATIISEGGIVSPQTQILSADGVPIIPQGSPESYMPEKK
jgi:hypothetical protein